MSAYEVILGPAAQRAVLGLGAKRDIKGLADSLKHELAPQGNARRKFQFEESGRTYTATPLSFAGYTAIHRPLSAEEMMRLSKQQGENAADRGYYVLDILGAGSEAGVPAPARHDI